MLKTLTTRALNILLLLCELNASAVMHSDEMNISLNQHFIVF